MFVVSNDKQVVTGQHAATATIITSTTATTTTTITTTNAATTITATTAFVSGSSNGVG